MDNVQSRSLLTRRSALMFAGAALPLSSQPRKAPASNAAGHPIVHFEIGCDDRARAEHFFGEVFGWSVQPNDPAGLIDTGSPQGIPGHITSLGHEPRHYAIFYVEVDDIQACLDKVNALGGKTIVPPIKIPSGGAFAWFADLDGNTIGLLKRA